MRIKIILATVFILFLVFSALYVTRYSETSFLSPFTRNSNVFTGDEEHIGMLTDHKEKTKFKVLIISDRDKYSINKKNKNWESTLSSLELNRRESGIYTIEFKKQKTLTGLLVEGSRGMELSELKFWNGKLYTFCDRTGIVYEIVNEEKLIPRYILPNGDGKDDQKGFKCEWATVKDGMLYVGSMGKEWTSTEGKLIGYGPMWVKKIDKNGEVSHLSWIHIYKKIRQKAGIQFPGYMIHEAIEWNPVLKRWFILPRRVSIQKYNADEDNFKGSNIIISASETFDDIKINQVGKIISSRGFSTFKFIPGRPTEIVALKTEELGDEMKSYIMVFDIEGKILLPETLVGKEKFEGLEISPI